jgi:hypothetical protein
LCREQLLFRVLLAHIRGGVMLMLAAMSDVTGMLKVLKFFQHFFPPTII